MDFPGTILVVSHDRVFLENVVTSTWLFEGEGRVQEYVGTDFDRWTRRSARPDAPAGPAIPVAPAGPAAPVGPARKKLSYKEQRELAGLPAKLEALEVESRALKERIAGPEFYKEGAEAIRIALAREQDVTGEIEVLYSRWQELEARS
jgi:ATP-binding cassette subfamily F protein uup